MHTYTRGVAAFLLLGLLLGSAEAVRPPETATGVCTKGTMLAQAITRAVAGEQGPRILWMAAGLFVLPFVVVCVLAIACDGMHPLLALIVIVPLYLGSLLAWLEIMVRMAGPCNP
jgi:hypothetical protein